MRHFSSGVPDWLAPVLLAPFIGSFLGVLILRLPDGRPVAMARSACDHCGHQLGWRDVAVIAARRLDCFPLQSNWRHWRSPFGPWLQ
jgi:prepilin signal peptidase PulO-like enzyme (type II secretory pathway)